MVKSLFEKLKGSAGDPKLQAVMYFTFFTSGMTSTLLGAILPFLKTEYHLSYVLSGSVLSAHQIGNLAAVFAAGFLPYLIGRKKSTVLLCSGIVIGLLLMTATGNYTLLLLAFLATGFGRGTSSNICNVVVSENSVNKTGALNVLHASFAVGALLSPILAILAAFWLNIGWRFSVWLVALMEAFALFFLWTSNLSDTPMRRNEEKQVDFLHSRSYWLNTSIMFLYLCSESSITGWLVTYFKDCGIMGTASAQSTATLLWIMIMTGRLLCARFSSRVNKNRLLIGMAVAQTLFFFTMIFTRNIGIIMFSLLGIGLSMSGFYPTTLSTMDPCYNSSTVAVGISISVATLGAIIMPIFVGIVAQKKGIAGGFSVIGVALLIMVILTLIKEFTSRRKVLTN